MPVLETTTAPIWYIDHAHISSSYEAKRPSFLMLHGAGGTHFDFPTELRRLPQGYVVAPDLPGHGHSVLPGRNTIDDYEADALALMDALGMSNVFLVGHSMGGAIALSLALNYPTRFKGLILIATGARLRVHHDILDNALENPSMVAALVTNWEWSDKADENLRDAGYQRLLDTDPNVLRGDFAACNAFDVTDRLAELQLPALIIGGADDKMTPMKYSEYLSEHIPNSQLACIKNCGHKVALEQPGAVATAIQRWLRKVKW